MPPKREFDAKTAETIQARYSDVVKPLMGGDARGGCMAAIYDGLVTALYGDKYATELRRRVYKDAAAYDKSHHNAEGTSNSVDKIMEGLKKDGRAGEPWTFSLKKKKWHCISPAGFKDKGVAECINQDLNKAANAWYFYGISASCGYHSVALAVDNTSTPRTIYWLDQNSNGLSERRAGGFTATTDVTATLDQILLGVGENQTTMWPLYNVDP
jgi:hypothetical protein